MKALGALALLAAAVFPVSSSGEETPTQAMIELGREVFMQTAQPPCGICHTLNAAGATGEIGPSLDELKPDVARVLKAVRSGVGVMPAYDGKLSTEQIEAVASFVAKMAGGGA